MPIDVDEELRLCKAEKSERSAMDSWWQSIKEVCVPKDAYITRSSSPTPVDDFDRIYDTTIIESADGLSNMMTAQLTPAGQQWVMYLPPFEFENDDEVCEWYAVASMIVQRVINQSNFPVVIADTNQERATVGTGTFLCYETGNKYSPVRFKHAPVGTYTFREDLDGNADTLRREFQATASQLQKQFPDGQFGGKVAEALADAQKKHSRKFTIWHVVKPREDRNPNYIDNKNMPYAECYICEEDKNVIEESGQWEFNASVSRFQTGADGSMWGVSPARKAMPAAAQANYLQEQLDILLDLQINPRVIAEAGMVGEIDMRAGRKTLVRSGALATNGGGVREWLTNGNYPLGDKRVQDKQNQIRKLFYHGMWADLARVEKEMTAEEVRAIREQAEMLFVGVNARFEADMKPIIARRVFGICLRAGLLPPPPRQLLKESNGIYDIPDPEVSYQSHLSRVLLRRAVENSDLLLTRLASIAQYQPDVLDEFDFAVHSRELARAFGFKAPFLRSSEDVTSMLAQKVRAQAAQQQKAEAVMAAQTASSFAPRVQEKMMQQQM
jgi:Bacteriophage head to tail connecting protein